MLDIFEPIKKKSISRAEIEAMTDEELLNHIHGEDGGEGFTPIYTQMAILNEYKQRQAKTLSRPHWSTSWSFVIAIIGLAISMASFWVAYSSLELSKASVQQSTQAATAEQNVLKSQSSSPAEKRGQDAQKSSASY